MSASGSTGRPTTGIIILAGQCGREVVPCRWQRGGPLRQASDSCDVERDGPNPGRLRTARKGADNRAIRGAR
jgi:hypothetical protein